MKNQNQNQTAGRLKGVKKLRNLINAADVLNTVEGDLTLDERCNGGELLIHLSRVEDLEHVFTVTITNVNDEDEFAHAHIPADHQFHIATEFLHTENELIDRVHAEFPIEDGPIRSTINGLGHAFSDGAIKFHQGISRSDIPEGTDPADVLSYHDYSCRGVDHVRLLLTLLMRWTIDVEIEMGEREANDSRLKIIEANRQLTICGGYKLLEDEGA